MAAKAFMSAMLYVPLCQPLPAKLKPQNTMLEAARYMLSGAVGDAVDGKGSCLRPMLLTAVCREGDRVTGAEERAAANLRASAYLVANNKALHQNRYRLIAI